eukprot:18379-Amorphochlora_amoeboformis.AAC.1
MKTVTTHTKPTLPPLPVLTTVTAKAAGKSARKRSETETVTVGTCLEGRRGLKNSISMGWMWIL